MFGSFKVNIPSLDVNIKGPSIPSKVGINVSGPSIGGGAGIHAHGVGPTLNVHGQGPHMGGGVGLNVHPPQVAPVNINVHGPSIAPVVNDFQYIIPESAHPHPLIIEEHLNGICKLCKVNIGGLAGYRCGACDIVLCFNCACRIFFGNKQVNCHPQHPLALTSRNTGWKCDICKNHFKGGASFYCRMCDFDACDLCYLAEGYPVGFVIPEPTIMLHPPVRPPMHPPHEPSVGYSSQPSGGPILPPQPAFPSPQDNETIMRLNETIKSYELKIKDLENENIDLRESNQDERSKLQATIDSLQKQLAAKDAEMKGFGIKIADLTKQVDYFEGQLKMKESELASINGRMMDETNQLHIQIDGLNAQLLAAQNQLKQFDHIMVTVKNYEEFLNKLKIDITQFQQAYPAVSVTVTSTVLPVGPVGPLPMGPHGPHGPLHP